MPFPIMMGLGALGSLLGMLSNKGHENKGLLGGQNAWMNKLLSPALGGLGGAGLGALLSGHGMQGSPAQTTQLPLYSPQQMGIQNQLAQQGMQNMDLSGIENQAMNRFNKQIVPSIAERFTAMGGSGGQNSSAFAGQLGQSGADISSQLAAMKPQLGMQQLQMGLQPQFENMYQPSQMGAGQGMALGGASGLASLFGPMLGSMFGGK